MLLMVDVVIDNVCVKKQRNIRKKSNENLQKRRFLVYFRYFRPEKIFLNLRYHLNFQQATYWTDLPDEVSQIKKEQGI